MNNYINYLAYSYIKNNLDAINNCIKYYKTDGDTNLCGNKAIKTWLDENGTEVFEKSESAGKNKYWKKGDFKESSSPGIEAEEIQRLGKKLAEIQKEEKRRKEFITIYKEKKMGLPHAFGKEVSSGRHNLTGMEESDCKFYADSIGYTWGGNSNDGNVFGCFLQHGPPGKVYYNKKQSMAQCGDVQGSTCVQRDREHVNKEECSYYAGSLGYKWGGNSNDGNVKGCFIQHEPKVVYFNENQTDTECGDVEGSKCVQKKIVIQKVSAEAKSKGDSFTDIPKKRNGIVYGILIAVLVFLYYKMRK